MGAWMDGWMDGWLVEWMDGQTEPLCLELCVLNDFFLIISTPKSYNESVVFDAADSVNSYCS